MVDERVIRARYGDMRACLDERGRRLFAAAEARSAGYGGIAAVARATGIARSTIGRGLKDLGASEFGEGTVRRAGGGRRSLVERDATLLQDLQRLLEPATLGDPMRPLLWVSKSHEKLAVALGALGHQVSASTIPKLLEQLKYRRQVNRKTKEGSHHADRDAQFEHINAQTLAFQAADHPVISVDTKKKELVGEYKNPGSDYRPEGCPEPVNVHDFVDKKLGKAIPYGVYDIAADAGCVSVGIDHDTAEFAVNSIHRWHETMGRQRYPAADRLMITADGGGSNGARVRLWKIELQKFADATGLTLAVCHYPPGTSKWNKIEHRMFCHITQNWRGTPLTSRLAVVELIAATTTRTGLKIRCELDTNTYAKGIKVSDAEMAALNIKGDAFHPEWNYTISPRSPEPPT
ncbi:MAG: ISAzo13 family transposase [Dongiaceae bacterium]